MKGRRNKKDEGKKEMKERGKRFFFNFFKKMKERRNKKR